MSEDIKLKRFDDIFRIMLLIVTISVSIGSLTFQTTHVSNTLFVILLSLFFWIVGHGFGINENFRGFEAFFKINGWIYASFIAIVLFVKACFHYSTIESTILFWCSSVALGTAVFPIFLLFDLLPKRKELLFIIVTLNTFSSLILNWTDLAF